MAVAHDPIRDRSHGGDNKNGNRNHTRDERDNGRRLLDGHNKIIGVCLNNLCLHCGYITKYNGRRTFGFLLPFLNYSNYMKKSPIAADNKPKKYKTETKFLASLIFFSCSGTEER